MEKHVRGSGSGKGKLSGKDLVQRDAEGVDITATVRGKTPGLFGREVVRRAYDLSRSGYARFLCCRSQTEVDDPAVMGPVISRFDEDVCRFQIPMDDTLGVRSVDRLRHIPHDRHLLLERQLLCRKVEPLPLDQLHRHEKAIVIFTDIEDGADIRVTDARLSASFPHESCSMLRAVVTENFERHGPPQVAVPRPVDGRHPALAADPLDAIARPQNPRRFLHSGHWLKAHYDRPERIRLTGLTGASARGRPR